MSISNILVEHAKDRPDHPAIEDLRAGRVVTYAELHELVDNAASNLLDLGVQAQDIVGVMLPDLADHVIVLNALEMIGAVSLSIDRALPPAEKKLMTKGLQLKAVITNDRYSKTSPVSDRRTLNIDTVCARKAAPAEHPNSAQSLNGSQPLIVIQSSGTTGKPKQIILTHRQFWSRLRPQVDAMQLTPNDRYLQVPGLTWVPGYRRCLNMLQIGGTVVIGHPLRNLHDYLSHFESQNITFVCLTPGHLQRMLPLLEDDGPRFPGLTIVVSGAPMTLDQYTLTRQKVTPNLFDSYGTNEIGGVVAATPQDHDRYPESVGRPLEGIEAQVVDENYQPLPPMEIGQLGFRGPHFPTEYHQNPEATARYFRGGWFYPGDFAAINKDGHIFLMGRTDDAINNEGTMFYPIEVERILESHPAVVEAAVFGYPHPVSGTVPVAAVVAGEFVAREALEEICKEQLAYLKRPQFIQLVPELPRNLGGKLIRSKLMEIVQPPWQESRTTEAKRAQR